MTDRLEVFQANDGWHWHRKSKNNKIISQGEGHPKEYNAWRAAYRANPDLNPYKKAVEKT